MPNHELFYWKSFECPNNSNRIEMKMEYNRQAYVSTTGSGIFLCGFL